MRKFSHLMFAVCVAALAFTSFTGEAQAQEGDDEMIGVGIVAGMDLGIEEFQESEILLGVDARVSLDVADAVGVVINPAITTMPFLDAEGVTPLQIDLNVLGEFDLDAPVLPYVGVGPAYYMVLISDFDNQTEFGINALAGASFDLDAPVAPFAQVRFTRVLADEGFNSLSVMAGAHFKF